MRLFAFAIFLTGVFTGCINTTLSQPIKDKSGTAISETVYELDIQEPSGLAFSATKDALYTVSDKNGSIYRIDFKGAVLEKLHYGGHDLEGIDVDRANGDIWVVEEGKQNIYHLSKNGDEIEKITSVHIDTKGGSGFEGIAKNGDTLYILIEKNPGKMIKYHIFTKKWERYSLSFAKDYSGIDYDPTDNSLWIVSDESKTLNHCNLNGTIIASQKIDVKQAEGVAIDRSRKVAWIIGDKGSRLHRIILKI